MSLETPLVLHRKGQGDSGAKQSLTVLLYKWPNPMPWPEGGARQCR